MLEIEAKARITDDAVLSMQTQLQQLCGNEQPLKKHDTYYRLAVHRDGVAVGSDQNNHASTEHTASTPHQRLLRIRTDNDTVYITTKRRTVTDGVEVNREDELTIPLAQHQQCHDFFTQLGAVKYIEKRKIGYRYQFGQYTIELVTVPPLGTFVEIEAVTPPTDEAAIARIKQGIFDIFRQLSIDNTQIESRKYIELLQLHQTEHR